MLLHLGNVTYIHNPSGHAKLFPVSGPTGHLKKTRAPGFIFLKTEVERKWHTNSNMYPGG